jgi:hypothetical protein
VNVNPKEALMNSARRVMAMLVVVLALGVVPAAYAAVDYSKNAAGGDYAPAASPQPQTPAATSSDSDFSWGAAAVGAGAALALVLVVSLTRSRVVTLRSRMPGAG